MKNIMGRFLRLQVRKHKRYRARNGVFVIFENVFSKNQVGDISMGGLSFYYEYRGRISGKGAGMIRVFANDQLYLKQVPFEMVSDGEAGAFVFKNKTVMRQSIRFVHMTHGQKDILKSIIHGFTDKGKIPSS